MSFISDLINDNTREETEKHQPCKGDVYYRLHDMTSLYIYGTTVNMAEGHEGEIHAVYTPTFGPYDVIYTLPITELKSPDKYRLHKTGLDLKEQLMNQFHNIDELLGNTIKG